MRSFLIVGFFLLFIIGCKDKSGGNEPMASGQQKEHSQEMKESVSRGAKIYNNFCASCHLTSGEGITGVFPPLKNSDWLAEKQTESIHAIKYGINGPIQVNGVEYDNLMPALGLNNQEVADVMNYINNSWGNNYGDPVTEEEVSAIAK